MNDKRRACVFFHFWGNNRALMKLISMNMKVTIKKKAPLSWAKHMRESEMILRVLLYPSERNEYVVNKVANEVIEANVVI